MADAVLDLGWDDLIMLVEGDVEEQKAIKATFTRWKSSGYSVAVYRNHHQDDPDLSRIAFVSFGNARAIYEGEPPAVMLTGKAEENSYVLVGVYRDPVRELGAVLDKVGAKLTFTPKEKK